MHIEQRKLIDVQPYGKNAKKHPEKQVNQIADSIREFGFNQPLVVDKEGVLIVGHGRYLAAHLLGIDTVPVVELDISEEKAKAYRLADNKLNESEWDMELVIAELKGLSLESVDLTGFSRKLVLNSNDKDDDVPPVPKTARTKPGDVYELGPHRIECADSANESSYARLMLGTKADMVFTDPPYNVNYKGSGKNTSEGIMNDKMDEAAFRHFLIACFNQMRSATKEGGGYVRLPRSHDSARVRGGTKRQQHRGHSPADLEQTRRGPRHGRIPQQARAFLLRGRQGHHAAILRGPHQLHDPRPAQERGAARQMGSSTKGSGSRGPHDDMDNETHPSAGVRTPDAKASRAGNVRTPQQQQGG